MSDVPVAIVTGASSGIGAATAATYARRGYRVVLAARRQARLERLEQQFRRDGGQAHVHLCDVTQEQQVRSLVRETYDRHGRCDVMVNNAGIGMFGRVDELSTDEMREIFEVNYFGLFWGAREAARVMIRQGHGHIFNVSSVIGKRGTPYHGAYCATKFAAVGLSDAMRVELAPRGIRVTCVCPSLTDTEFFSHSRRGRAGGSTFQRLKGGMQDPKIVARKIVSVTGKECPELVFTPGGKFLARVGTLLPRFTDWLMGFYRKSLEETMAQAHEADSR
jgi:short-subunit dehydrogenase